MSAEVRLALATAASTVEGITCAPYFQQSTKPGSAMVRRDNTNYPDKFGGWVTWQVLVMLPQDLASAEKFLDEKVPALRAALAPEMRVTDAIPQQLALPDGGNVPILLMQGSREE